MAEKNERLTKSNMCAVVRVRSKELRVPADGPQMFGFGLDDKPDPDDHDDDGDGAQDTKKTPAKTPKTTKSMTK